MTQQCVGWQVTLCEPIWQVTPHSWGSVNSHTGPLTFFNIQEQEQQQEWKDHLFYYALRYYCCRRLYFICTCFLIVFYSAIQLSCPKCEIAIVSRRIEVHIPHAAGLQREFDRVHIHV